MTSLFRIARATVVAVALATPAAAQYASVTPADIQKLQDNTFLAERDVTQLRARDAARANQLTTELDDLKDEVIYLKVKLRKERTLTRNEYADVRDRIEDVRARAQSFPSRSTSNDNTRGSGLGGPPERTTSASAPVGTRTRGQSEIPVGTELDVRLTTALNSGTALVEDRFEATTLSDVVVDGRVLVPVGSVMRGVVSSVDRATRANRTAKMTVIFDQVTVNGRSYPMRGTVTKAIEGEGIKGEAGKLGVGAGVGAIIGGILGGGKGALAGVLIGGGGTLAATEGKEIELPQGSQLTVRIDSPLQLPSLR